MLGQEELRYWGLAEELLEPCCLLNYFPNTASARQEKEEESQLEKSQVDLFLRETHIMFFGFGMYQQIAGRKGKRGELWGKSRQSSKEKGIFSKASS